MKKSSKYGKLVYLFELDSVRKTDEEIIIGQKTLFDEIVSNGNTVVLTYNQLVDSRGFYSLFDNQDYYDNLLKLFEAGCIKISQFGELRTISQYILNTIDDNKSFIYSALPLKSNQKRLTALVRRCLLFSDLSETYGYTRLGHRTEDELRDLFVEVNETIDSTGSVYQSVSNTDLSVFQMQEIVENLYWMLSIVLRLSALHHVYLTPKKPAEYQDLRLHNYLEIVSQYDVCDDSLWNNAIKIITNLECYGKDDRTEYLVELRKLAIADSKGAQINILEYYYAESIVCLCYNYACEMSIRNISKHYDINELREKGSLAHSFRADFFSRLKQDWNGGEKACDRYLTGESNSFVEFKDLKKIPDLHEAVRMIGYFKRSGLNRENDYNGKPIPNYEYGLKRQRKSRKMTAFLSIAQRIVLCLICVFIACALEVLMNTLQDFFESKIEVSSLVFSITQTIIFLFVAETITSLLASRFKWLISLSEAIGGIGTFVGDMMHILFGKANSYQNKAIVGEHMESYSEGQPIDFIKTKSLARYRKLKLLDNSKDAFKPVSEYPIADTSSNEVVKKLLRSEELFNYKYGVVYNSNYNTLIVDPIENGEEDFYPYERVLPTNGRGVVVVAMFGEEFILLNQTRHAIRGNQLCFPRGFGEPGLSPAENAKKELKEEINAEIDDEPILLGKLTPDSGLVSSEVEVYLVCVNNYSYKEVHEGIQSLRTYTEEELSRMIQNGSIDDGFTLSAYLLYKVYKSQL